MGGFVTALTTFLVFALTMAVLIFVLALLAASWGPRVARPLRVLGRRVQVVAAVLILVVGLALAYEGGLDPGFWDRLILQGH